MLGQEIGVPALLPLAVKVLLRDPVAEGDHYPGGDLLSSVSVAHCGPDGHWRYVIDNPFGTAEPAINHGERQDA